MEEIHLNRRDIQSLARQVISLSLSSEKREEELWLCDRYQDFLRRSGAKNCEEGDLQLAQRMAEIAGTTMSDSPPRRSESPLLAYRAALSKESRCLRRFRTGAGPGSA